jgi:hypothetical protein
VLVISASKVDRIEMVAHLIRTYDIMRHKVQMLYSLVLWEAMFCFASSLPSTYLPTKLHKVIFPFLTLSATGSA